MLAPTTRVLASLAEHGLLLKQDKRLPNVVTILIGEALPTSWWSHAKAPLIFRVLSELGDHPDVLLTGLGIACMNRERFAPHAARIAFPD
jgi:hypothetical protein